MTILIGLMLLLAGSALAALSAIAPSGLGKILIVGGAIVIALRAVGALA